MNDPCAHKEIVSLFLAETDDHVTLCRDCRTVTHWCNHVDDEWRDHEKSRTPENTTWKNFDDGE
jgi:hypothetical protein